MAAELCNFCPGSGLKKLDDFVLSKKYINRPYSNRGLNASSSTCYTQQKSLLKTFTIRLKSKRANQGTLKASADAQESKLNTVNKEEEISTQTLIWRAIKLPIYSVALVPLTVGSAASVFHTGVFSASRYSLLLLASVFIITWLNLSNDVYDFDTGADKNKKESVVNLIGSRTGTLVAAYVLLATGFALLTLTSVQAGSKRAIILLASAILCGYVYQCPPFRLSYKGLGEPLCFAAFGPFATSAFYLLQSGTSSVSDPLMRSVLSASFLVGLTTTLILFCSHFHQIEDDLAVAKMSPLVRIGTERGSRIVKWGVTGLYVLTLAFGLTNAIPFTCTILCALTIPLGRLVSTFVEENHEDKEKIFMAKYYCVRLHAFFGAALALGLVLPKILPQRLVIPASITIP